MASRDGMALDDELRSDVAPIGKMVAAALAVGEVVAMKDPTRGGLAGALCEMAQKAGVGIVIDASRVPVGAAVVGAAELYGIDPLHVANEGKVVFGVAAADADGVLGALRADPLAGQAAIIGEAVIDRPGEVVLDTGFGRRLLRELDGEPLPRIC